MTKSEEDEGGSEMRNEENAAHDDLMRDLRVMEAEATRRAEASVAELRAAVEKRKREKEQAGFFGRFGRFGRFL